MPLFDLRLYLEHLLKVGAYFDLSVKAVRRLFETKHLLKKIQYRMFIVDDKGKIFY